MWKDTLLPSWRSRCLIGVWMKILPPYLRREISEHYRDDFRKWLVKKKKFTCTVQRKTTLTWLKKILFSVFWIKRKINVLLSNIIHLLKRKRQSNNTQQWTIDKMTVFCASVHRLSLTVACHRCVFSLRSFVWVFFYHRIDTNSQMYH